MSSLSPLYLITDRHQVPAGRQLLDLIDELLQSGVRMLQLREKDLPAAALYPLAKEVRALTNKHGCALLINDRIDLALAVNADGVHLGGHSLPVSVARKLLGPDRFIGISTHSPAEIPAAAQQGADFATFGPVFYTPSKAQFGKPTGLNLLQQACATAPIPVYALGGIKPENCRAVKQAGATGIGLISALLCADSPTSECQKLLALLHN